MNELSPLARKRLEAWRLGWEAQVPIEPLDREHVKTAIENHLKNRGERTYIMGKASPKRGEPYERQTKSVQEIVSWSGARMRRMSDGRPAIFYAPDRQGMRRLKQRLEGMSLATIGEANNISSTAAMASVGRAALALLLSNDELLSLARRIIDEVEK